jgi:hypothetical protein
MKRFADRLSALGAGTSTPDRVDSVLVGLLSVLACLQGYLFLTGYRLTADDVEFQYHLMKGWDAAWDFVWLAAVSQGRVVHLLDLPFSMVAAYFAENFAFRLFYTGLYFGCFALLAVYVSMLARLRVAALITLVLLSLHPLDYFHLPPNAYPAHLTLPFLLILLARMGLLRARGGRGPAGSGWELGMLACCFVGMLFSEYAFLFTAALVGAEFLARLARDNPSGRPWASRLRACLLHPHTVKDAVVLTLFLVIYLGFRALYPSTYEGNQVAGDLELVAVARTLVGHVIGGTSLASMVRYSDRWPEIVVAMGYGQLLIVAGIGAFTFLAGMISLQRVPSGGVQAALARRCSAIVVAALFGAALVTLPLAMTAKYQSWCGDLSACIFLDSRISYLGVGVAVAALMVAMVCTRARRISSLAVSAVFSGVLATLGVLTYLHNFRIELDMQRYVSGWERAERLACLPAEQLEGVGALLPKLIDPPQRISMTAGFDREAYWRDYIELQRNRQDCSGAPGSIGDIYAPLPSGRIAFGQGASGTGYLGTGWYSPEGWGVWSEGNEAQVYLPVRGPVGSVVIEAHALLLPTHTEQPMVFSVNGVEVGRAVLDKLHDNRIELSIPPAVSAEVGRLGVLILQFHFLAPVNQKALGLSEDGRTMALGLRFITVRERSESDEQSAFRAPSAY